MKLRPEEIQEILRIIDRSELKNVHLEIGGVKLEVSKEGGIPIQVGTSMSAPLMVTPSAAAASSAPTTSSDFEPVPASVVEAPSADAPTDTEGLVAVTAPSLGVFYRRPAPDQPPFVDLESMVEADDPVCLIEVMKLFNRVTAGTPGRITQILVKDGMTVEYGQVLMLIDPA